MILPERLLEISFVIFRAVNPSINGEFSWNFHEILAMMCLSKILRVYLKIWGTGIGPQNTLWLNT